MTTQAQQATLKRLLVVDDEVFIAEALTTALRHAGFDTRCVFTGRGALDLAREWSPDLMLLDVMLPDLTGYDVCRELVMAGHNTAVIFLSARDEVSDRVRGFSVGADDYVPKPFSLEEVIARVRAVLLRGPRVVGRDPQGDNALRYADLVLDDERHLVSRGDTVFDLSPTEYVLLRYLMQNPERVLSKTQILDHVWRYDFGGSPGVVETFVSLLRKKLNAAGPPLIQTVRGFGYVLRAQR
jgi:two-component system OmpR family response regulator